MYDNKRERQASIGRSAAHCGRTVRTRAADTELIAALRGGVPCPVFLLIDDDPDFSAALSAELRCAGHRIICAASCAEGLDALSSLSEGEWALDAVLVDMFMPRRRL